MTIRWHFGGAAVWFRCRASSQSEVAALRWELKKAGTSTLAGSTMSLISTDTNPTKKVGIFAAGKVFGVLLSLSACLCCTFPVAFKKKKSFDRQPVSLGRTNSATFVTALVRSPIRQLPGSRPLSGIFNTYRPAFSFLSHRVPQPTRRPRRPALPCHCHGSQAQPSDPRILCSRPEAQ